MNVCRFVTMVVTGLWLLSLSTTDSAAQSFPEVTVETIEGRTVTLPDELVGKYSLVGIAGGKKAEEMLRTWQVPVYNKFIAKTGLMDEMFDVRIRFLPLFTGAMKAAKGRVVNKLKENNEPLVLNHVLIYAGDREPFEAIDAFDRKEPRFFLLDPEGRIVYRAEGPFRQRYFDDIETILTQ